MGALCTTQAAVVNMSHRQHGRAGSDRGAVDWKSGLRLDAFKKRLLNPNPGMIIANSTRQCESQKVLRLGELLRGIGGCDSSMPMRDRGGVGTASPLT
jgi:hypothetical protein